MVTEGVTRWSWIGGYGEITHLGEEVGALLGSGVAQAAEEQVLVARGVFGLARQEAEALADDLTLIRSLSNKGRRQD